MQQSQHQAATTTNNSTCNKSARERPDPVHHVDKTTKHKHQQSKTSDKIWKERLERASIRATKRSPENNADKKKKSAAATGIRSKQK